jgi:hypothetical protein
MKNIFPFLVVLVILAGCKKELVKKPDNLIEKEKMVSIMYDLSILDAIKIQNPGKLDSFRNNLNQYIFKKYKIDSVQFAQSNIYYAADYDQYGKMIEKVKARLDKDKSHFDSLVLIKKKKDSLQTIAKKKLKLKREADSIKKIKQEQKLKKETDSIKKAKEIKTAKTSDSIKKAKKKKAVL